MYLHRLVMVSQQNCYGLPLNRMYHLHVQDSPSYLVGLVDSRGPV
jgi:hypothetical protein